MIRFDHRIRVTATIALVSLAIVTLLGSTLYIASERMELALVEQLVSEEMDFLVQRYQSTPDYNPPQRPNVTYYILENDESRDAGLPYELRNLQQGHHEMYLDAVGGERDVFIKDVNARRFVVVYDIGPYEIREEKFKRLIFLSILLVLALAILLGHLLSGLLTRQLTTLAHRVKSLVPNQPYVPLTTKGQDKEVAMLAMAFDKYHEVFDNMIRREQDFTANVAHELRTPLTAIRTSCELLGTDSALHAKSKSRIDFILQAVDSMQGHTESLLFLARGQQADKQEDIALREVVEDVLAQLNARLSAKNLDLKIEIPAATTVLANRQALQLILINLLENAVSYTQQGFIKVKYSQSTLSVTDSGTGIAQEQLADIFKRSYRASTSQPGLGLGLDIVSRICSQYGWHVEVESVLDQGSTFSIIFK